VERSSNKERLSLKNAHAAVLPNVTSQHERLAAAAIESLDTSVELDLDIGSGMHVRALRSRMRHARRRHEPGIGTISVGSSSGRAVFAARRAGGAVGVGPFCRRPVFDWHLARPAAPRRGRANARSLRKYRTGLLDTTRAARPGHRLAGRIGHDFVGPPQPRRSPDLAGDPSRQWAVSPGRPARRLPLRTASLPALPQLGTRGCRARLMARLSYLGSRQRLSNRPAALDNGFAVRAAPPGASRLSHHGHRLRTVR
jgi:hypothetical protein